MDETLAEAERVIASKQFLATGDSVLVCAGFIDKLPGKIIIYMCVTSYTNFLFAVGLTNTIKVYNFGEISYKK